MVPRSNQGTTLALLFVAGMVNFFDRASLSVANSSVRAELHLDATQMGWLLTAFSLAYGLAQLPLLGLLERFGTRVMLGSGLALWSAAQLATGAVPGLRSFLGLRVVLGAGEAPFYPAGIATIRGTFAVEHRARATAAMNAAQALSLALAPPVLTWWMLRVGWRWMFATLGLMGLVVAVLWMVGQRDDAARSEVRSGTGWSSALRDRVIWGMMLGWGGINFTSWLYLAWLPGYLEGERHVSMERSGWMAGIPFLAAAVGMMLSGVVSDWRVRRGLQAAVVHRRNLVAGMLVSAASTLAVSRAATTAQAVALISVALFAIHFAGTSGWGLLQAVASGARVASLGALMNFAGFVIASAAPVLTGWIVDRTHAYALAFVMCAAVTAAGALSYAVLTRPADRQLAVPN